MARKGDVVECGCGRIMPLTNDRVPMHNRADGGGSCESSGANAENWEARPLGLSVQQVSVAGVPRTLACPECKRTGWVTNAPEKSGVPLVCTSCGTLGGVLEFLQPVRAPRATAPFKPDRGRYVEPSATAPAQKVSAEALAHEAFRAAVDTARHGTKRSTLADDAAPPRTDLARRDAEARAGLARRLAARAPTKPAPAPKPKAPTAQAAGDLPAGWWRDLQGIHSPNGFTARRQLHDWAIVKPNGGLLATVPDAAAAMVAMRSAGAR